MSAAAAATLRVLVVDDDRDVREIVEEVLTGEGYVVSTASNGEEALAELRSNPALPNAILLDLSMPIMDGATFREEQLRDAVLAEIPVIVFSAAARIEERVRGLDAAATVTKPVDLHVLLSTVRRFCR